LLLVITNVTNFVAYNKATFNNFTNEAMQPVHRFRYVNGQVSSIRTQCNFRISLGCIEPLGDYAVTESARTMVFDVTNDSGKSKKNLGSFIRFFYIAYKQTR
jgi:hypothetical protein